VSQTSSVIRAAARAAGSRGSSGGSGQRSSTYSRITVDSKIRTSPSISTGTSARGLAAANGPSVRPVPKVSGSSAVKATPFSRRAIFTFWA
jgi:hypothetical protein